MGEPTVECYNCGRENPGWAQICRTCGVSLRGAERFASGPPPRFPTDANSIVSMVAAVGTIVGAIFVGLLLSNLDPSPATALDPEVTATPIASATPEVTATAEPTAEPTVEPTPEPTPALPGELLFGTALDPTTRRVSAPQDSFAPGENFAYSITMPAPFNVPEVFVGVVRIEDDGTETLLQEPATGQPIDATQATVAFEVPAANLILGGDGAPDTGDEFGVGSFVMRIYAGPDQLIAAAPFELRES